jgi:hypothetical protein
MQRTRKTVRKRTRTPRPTPPVLLPRTHLEQLADGCKAILKVVSKYLNG